MMSFMSTFLLLFSSQMLMYYFMPSATLALALSSQTDKLALLALKEKLTNGVQDALPSWNQSLHFCEWQGVTCGRRHMRVSALHLNKQPLGGTLGPSLGNLTFLRVLNLSQINLHGEIPSQVGRLKRLQVLNLSINHLEGGIPTELANCTNIKVIDLSLNQLTGGVPSWFGSMMQLTLLRLAFNNLVGSIPYSLGNVSSLQIITLLQNHLEGNIPYSLGKLSNLKRLSLSLNNLSGEIPHSLYNLSNIQIFDLGENNLTGSLPSNIDLAFPNVKVFYVDNNNMSGSFPSSISNLTELQWFSIAWNGFSGPIPSTLGSLNKLHQFHIGTNNFGSGGIHDLDFLSSLTNCTQLSQLILDNNNFSGKLPYLIGNLSVHLSLLIIGINQIHGVIPESIGELTSLTILSFGVNLFEGIIPDSIGKLKNLVGLRLEANKLSGNIPISIGNLTILSELYLNENKLEGKIPFSLKYCTQLQKLSISENKLSGDIPNQTFRYLASLIYIFLYNNSLTGPIPSEFGNLKQLSLLYLDANKLSGEIPNDLASCIALTELGLGSNLLQGSMPLFLGSLRSLEILVISNNNLSSTIPFELEKLPFLNTLDLSFNNLYGEVPKGGVFSNVTQISLTGNKNLCGGIPQLKLPRCFRVPSKKHKRSLKKKLILISVIGGVVISFIAFIIVHFLTRKPKRLPSSPSLRNGNLRVTYGELHDATNGFYASNLVGTGSFGSVYKGSLLQFERPVVVKVLNLQTRGAAKSFVAECKALANMKHRNLVKILTCCSSVDYNGEDFKAIVFEFMPNGSLEKLLYDGEGSGGNRNLSFTERVDIAIDVAHALDYLHNDTEQVVVHCDVKPSNVLLDDDFVAHLGDFGLARLIHGGTGHSSNDQVSSSTIIKGTIGYVPPEYGAGGQVSSQGDIYSYGILLLEMLTGKRPTNDMFNANLNLHEFCKTNIPEGILEIVDSHLLMPFVEDQTGIVENKIRMCLVMFAGIGIACSEEFPTHRMLIKDVIVKLNEIKSKFTC